MWECKCTCVDGKVNTMCIVNTYKLATRTTRHGWWFDFVLIFYINWYKRRSPSCVICSIFSWEKEEWISEMGNCPMNEFWRNVWGCVVGWKKQIQEAEIIIFQCSRLYSPFMVLLLHSVAMVKYAWRSKQSHKNNINKSLHLSDLLVDSKTIQNTKTSF